MRERSDPTVSTATFEEDALGEKFASVFAGRTDAYGDDAGFCVHEEVTFVNYWAHLWDAGPIGIYNVADGNVVRWGAIDIDYDDIQEAWNVHDLLKSVGVNSWVERSRSKGYHVWTFVDDWIPAATMRRALLVVRDFLKIKAREVYPKQEELTPDKPLGNWLRLPYPGALTDIYSWQHGRRVMMERENFIVGLPLQEFLSHADLYADPLKLEALAARWHEPRRVATTQFSVDDQWGAKARIALHRLNVPLLWHIVKHGPSEGQDRSSTLMRIANMAMKHGATMPECGAIVAHADTQPWCQKYVGRADGVDRIEEIVVRVYSDKGSIDSDSDSV
jgi:hypothetical protein